MATQSEKCQEDMDYVTDCAQGRPDPLHNVLVTARNILGTGASLYQTAETMLDAIFARNVCVGNLTAHEPGFQPWPGTPREWLEGIRDDVERRGDIPDPGELGWLHIPA